MRKATLSPNPALQNKQAFIVQGMEEVSASIVTRDSFEIAIEAADRPDGTKIPIGRTNPGEFKISIDLADMLTRNRYEEWADQCIDVPSSGLTGNGINPNYKRSAIVIYHRLYSTDKPEDASILYMLEGCFITSRTLPDFQLDGKEASMFEFNVSYDNARRLKENTLPSGFTRTN